jgi:BTB/POZ domain
LPEKLRKRKRNLSNEVHFLWRVLKKSLADVSSNPRKRSTRSRKSESSKEGTIDDDSSKMTLSDSESNSPPNALHQRRTDEMGRMIIYVDNTDFTTMHNILYFLYTGSVNLHNPETWEGMFSYPNGYPGEADAFALFRAANMYLLDDLESRCFHYLVATCTVENICTRLFSPDCRPYEALTNAYRKYLIKNYNAVRSSKEWEKAYLGMDDGTPEELQFRKALFLEISKMVRIRW